MDLKGLKVKTSSNSATEIGSEIRTVTAIHNESISHGRKVAITTLIFDGSDHALVASGTIRKPTNPREHGLTSGFYDRFSTPQDWAVAHGRVLSGASF